MSTRLSVALTTIFLFFSSSPMAGGGGPAGPASEPNYSQSDVLLLAVYVLLALVFSFLCSVAEAVLLSITPAYIGGLRDKRPGLAAKLKKLKVDNLDRSLAAILTLNTIAHTVGAIGSGSKATAVFGSAWFGVFSAVMTLMILFLSEIIPKTLGAVHWRRLAGLTATFIRLLIVCLYPLILLSEQLTKLIARDKKHGFSRDEFIAMADIGEESGQIQEHESQIIRNLLQSAKLKASDIMTPRTVIVAAHRAMTINEALDGPLSSPFSRLPLYDRDLDDMNSFVLKDNALLAKAKGKGDAVLHSLERELVSVPEDMSLTSLLDKLQDQRLHIARVVDPYGGTQGLVTLEDAVESLLGMEIVDEMDTVEDMQVLARQQWAKRARSMDQSDTKETAT